MRSSKKNHSLLITDTKKNSDEKIYLPLDKNVRRLNEAERKQFFKDGYIKNLPVFAHKETYLLQNMFNYLAGKLPKNVDINKTNCWHKASKSFYELCRTPAILNYVEDLIGPNFFQWGGQFFVKYPRDGSEVPWHQDAQYWPLTPQNTVTVWLAVYDTDDENAAMKIVKGSHKNGNIPHHENNASHLVLNQEADIDQIHFGKVKTIDLKAGEISLHDDGLLHGSGPNNSSRMRAGITMRFAPTNVRCDLSIWPNFEASLARGQDLYKLNPTNSAPKGENYPIRLFQHSSEFS